TPEMLSGSVRDRGQCVAERDHLALLGEADASVLRRRRHGGDREVRAPAATTDSPAAAVEQAEIDVVPAAHTPERILRAVQRPVGHPVATVLVAVRVAEHALLGPAAHLELHGVYAISEQRAHVVRSEERRAGTA